MPIFILLPTFKSLPTKFIPNLAVTIPIESIFVTSSYVNTPPTFRLPVIVALAAFIVPPVTLPSIGPTNLVAVTTPVD